MAKKSAVTALVPKKERNRPGVQASRERPIAAFADWDRVHQIRNVLVGFESGNGFGQAAVLADAMTRDDRIAGVMATRAGAIAGATIEVKPANSKRLASRVAEILGGSDDQPGLWDTMFPESAVAEMSWWGNMLGIALGEIVWRNTETEQIPILRVWHPQFLRWDQNERRYYVDTADGPQPIPRIDEEPQSDGHWVLWTPGSYRNCWRQALLRPLAMLYLSRQWTYRDWARYNEKHGAPADKVFVPEGASAQEKEEFYAAVNARGSDSTILLPRGETADTGYDVEILEATARSWDSFEKHISKLETDMAICVLGQNLTTEVQGGSLAATKEHGAVRLDKLRQDAKIARCLRQQVLTHWTRANYGEEELTPRVSYFVDPPGDDTKIAQTYESLGRAIRELTQAGMQVDIEALADKFGVPMEDVEEAAAGVGTPTVDLTASAMSAVVKVNEARAAAGLGPLSSGPNDAPDPDGELTVAAFMAKHGETVAAAVNAEAGTPEGPLAPVAPVPPIGEPPAKEEAPVGEPPAEGEKLDEPPAK